MKKITNVDMTVNAKKVKTAFDRFFKKYPSLKYWRETFEYMADSNEKFFSDDIMADGTKNKKWRYALHLDTEDNYIYMAVIERAEAI